jgi:hypothetical protein
MPTKVDRVKQPMLWLLVIASMVLWFLSVKGVNFSGLSFIPPFQNLNPFFWLGLLFILLSFFLGNKGQKIIAVVILMIYFVATLSIIFDYPVMHDSVINTAYFPDLQRNSGPYGKTYLGMGIVLDIVRLTTRGDSLQIAHYFPVGVGILYLLILGLFYYSWKGILFSSFLSFGLFALFFIVFGETFYLRFNASPQTIAYLLFLFSLSIVPLTNKSIWVRILLLITILMMIITHPVSPLLSLPAIGAAIVLVDKQNNRSLTHAIEFLLLVVVGYLAWTLFMGDWIIRQAVNVMQSAMSTEKIIPIVNGATYISQIKDYVFWHRILLVSLLILLFTLYLITFRTKVWVFVTAWGIMLLPAFLLLFSYKDFFDRILLFGLIPCAIIVGEGGQKIITHFQKAKIPAAGLLTILALLSAYISYFFIGAVDRVTADEVEANRYISSINIPLKVYTNGFNLPTPAHITSIPANRGIIDVDQALKADVILISKQMENAVLMNPRAPIQVSDFIKLVQKDYILLQTFGDVKVYMKPPNELGNP